MSLRDWLAGQALAAMANNPWTANEVVYQCYHLADAMLVARQKGPSP